jgi:hypothetical protein
MAAPDLEIHVYRVPPSRPARRRAGLPAWVWFVAMLACPPLLFVGLAILAVTLMLTGLGLLVVAASGVVWLVGRVLALRWPDAGAGLASVHRLGDPATTTHPAEDQREAAIASLRRAYACGEIELSEFEERAGWALRFDAAAWAIPKLVDPG